MEIERFEIEFVERTKRILEDYQGEYKLSNAINCTLGLIILPSEVIQNRASPWLDKNISDIEELTFLRLHIFNPIRKVKKDGTIEYYPKTLKNLLKKIRNGLAHQHIEPVNENGLFTGITICNYFKMHMDLKAEFKRSELERFALFIADKYLRFIV